MLLIVAAKFVAVWLALEATLLGIKLAVNAVRYAHAKVTGTEFKSFQEWDKEQEEAKDLAESQAETLVITQDQQADQGLTGNRFGAGAEQVKQELDSGMKVDEPGFDSAGAVNAFFDSQGYRSATEQELDNSVTAAPRMG